MRGGTNIERFYELSFSKRRMRVWSPILVTLTLQRSIRTPKVHANVPCNLLFQSVLISGQAFWARNYVMLRFPNDYTISGRAVDTQRLHSRRL